MPDVLLMPTGEPAVAYLEGLRREKIDQQGTGGDPDRVKAIDAEIKLAEAHIRKHTVPGDADSAPDEARESTGAAQRETAVRGHRNTR